MTDRPVALAVFDIAGTTVEEHQAVYAALGECVTRAGVAVTDSDVSAWMGADKRDAIRALLAKNGDTPSDALVVETFATFRHLLDDAYRTTPPTALKGVTEALITLKHNGIRVALTTGFDREVSDSVLAAVGWPDGLIDAVICGDDVPSGRPAPYLIFRAMEATSTTSVGDVLSAGDTVLDLRAGANAGARYVVGVLSGGQDRTTLETAPHTHILDSVASVPEVLGLDAP